METVLKFPGTASCQGIHSHLKKRLALRSLSLKRTCNFSSDNKQIRQLALSFRRQTRRKFWNNHGISATPSNADSKFSPNSLSEKVEQFYAGINGKNLKQLDECISNDAQFDDYSFPKPFNGKKEVMHFLKMLTASMGQNVKFSVRHICEGSYDYTATALWHMEWKSEHIPFTRGCTFFEYSKEGEEITIKKAEVLIESPIKPGSIVLTLLKTVTSFFDDFPRAAEWFLRSPHTVLRWIAKIYSMVIAPIFNPLLQGYIRFWDFATRLLGFIYSLVVAITKKFIK